ncbi:hypothetical protein B5C26_14470 [Photorhabdus luminescens]|uniref:Lipoprotein n=1 Tax=Photorhabdus luminescens subsp. mexicana TaxID=2100167 RepID=A0A4R4JQ15_PHOLU|nr:hypothetical protein [Photorhabdus luminescens]OWO81384.1 hypothetical protein B5C26_14470 [Photorhabdus luminescens]TDB56096.1 hypothetical protein C5468_02480 [Photorhabdus luminescens subsp. mexicana]
MRPIIASIFVIFLLSGCVTFKQGEPLKNGVVSFLESEYPQYSSHRFKLNKVVELHVKPILFNKIKEFCKNKNAIFEQYTMNIGWCISKDKIPLFMMYKSYADPDLGTFTIAEKQNYISDKDWIIYSKEFYPYLWSEYNKRER